MPSLEDESQSDTKTAYASFWDFSGQEDYYNSHHIFLTSDAVYLVIFNLSTCLSSESEIGKYIG